MPKIVDHQKHRAELVALAAPVFRGAGYSNIGMRDIARELGVSKSALYHYFPTKLELFTACSEAIVAEVKREAAEIAASVSPESKLDRLLNYVEQVKPLFRDDLALVLDYARSQEEKDAKAANLAKARDSMWAIGALADDDIDGQAVTCLVLGALLLWALGSSNPSQSQLRTLLAPHLQQN